VLITAYTYYLLFDQAVFAGQTNQFVISIAALFVSLTIPAACKNDNRASRSRHTRMRGASYPHSCCPKSARSCGNRHPSERRLSIGKAPEIIAERAELFLQIQNDLGVGDCAGYFPLCCG
jgi:hypothetical protein